MYNWQVCSCPEEWDTTKVWEGEIQSKEDESELRVSYHSQNLFSKNSIPFILFTNRHPNEEEQEVLKHKLEQENVNTAEYSHSIVQ